MANTLRFQASNLNFEPIHMACYEGLGADAVVGFGSNLWSFAKINK